MVPAAMASFAGVPVGFWALSSSSPRLLALAAMKSVVSCSAGVTVRGVTERTSEYRVGAV